MTIPSSTFDSNAYFGVTAAKPRSELNMETFMTLLATQLANQNPLEPMNDRDFFAQMAQLGTVQGLDKMRESLDVSQAAALMGKTVTALRPMSESGSGMNSLVTGTVRRLTMLGGEHYLELEEPGGAKVTVRMANVREISE
jgi:flagellar basal-body rod modification protein FlgD